MIDSTVNYEAFKELVQKRLASNDTSVIIARRPCILAMVKLKSYEGKK